MVASTQAHRTHSSQIQRHAYELELGVALGQAPHAELAKPQHVLDPAVGRLGDPLALSASRLALFGLQLGGHAGRVRVALAIDL